MKLKSLVKLLKRKIIMIDTDLVKAKNDEIIKIIQDAGELLLNYFHKINELTVERKQGEGLVSEADRETEKFLFEKLTSIVPEAKFIGEESSFDDGQKSIAKGVQWIIDPLDGTSNFLSGFNYFCVSVALCFDGEPIFGWIYRPSTKETFSAVKGEGAFLNKKVLTTQERSIKDALLVTGFCVEKGQKFDAEFELFKKVMEHTRGIRRLGSAALDICYCSTQLWGGFWERGLSPWDVAAAGLIALESGLKVTSYQGNEFDPFDSSIIVGNPIAHRELLRVINNN